MRQIFSAGDSRVSPRFPSTSLQRGSNAILTTMTSINHYRLLSLLSCYGAAALGRHHRHPLHSRSAGPQLPSPELMRTPSNNPNSNPFDNTSPALTNTGSLGSQMLQDASLAQQGGGCTFSGPSCADDVVSGKGSCSNIVISNCQVPGGVTLDLTRLADGTQVSILGFNLVTLLLTTCVEVTFEGTTTFGTARWQGPLVAISGNSLTIAGASNSVLDGNGGDYWDNMGEDGPAKPKFFAIRAMRSSNIDGITLMNTPVQAFSISNVQDLIMTNCVVDNRAGDGAGAKNTDGFNVGSSNGVTISGARVHNQDDCRYICMTKRNLSCHEADWACRHRSQLRHGT